MRISAQIPHTGVVWLMVINTSAEQLSYRDEHDDSCRPLGRGREPLRPIVLESSMSAITEQKRSIPLPPPQISRKRR
jgi:hypothetical protein